jgi:hypothetical protein
LIEVNKNENYLGISIEVDSDDVSFNVLFPWNILNIVQQEYLDTMLLLNMNRNPNDIIVSAPTGSGQSEGFNYSILFSVNTLFGKDFFLS